MEGALLPLVRFALYADLMLLAGLAAWLTLGSADRRNLFRGALPAGAIAWLAGGAIVLSLVAALASVGAMMGQPVLALDAATVQTILFDTEPGRVQLVRLALLVLAFLASIAPLGRPLQLGGALLGAALALASFAWTGHAAATEGAAGLLHRVNDALHLLTAALWLGAIAGFAAAAASLGRSRDAPRLALAASELRRFATLGTWLVGLVVVTGAANLAFVAGWPGVLGIWPGDYGTLMFGKIALFGAMLAAAGLHRWVLAPRLFDALAAERALPALRASLAAELLFAMGILAVVGWLGLTAP